MPANFHIHLLLLRHEKANFHMHLLLHSHEKATFQRTLTKDRRSSTALPSGFCLDQASTFFMIIGEPVHIFKVSWAHFKVKISRFVLHDISTLTVIFLNFVRN